MLLLQGSISTGVALHDFPTGGQLPAQKEPGVWGKLTHFAIMAK